MSDATRTRILSAARDLFVCRSYADVGTADLCRAAGVQKGTLYHHFANKRAVALAVLEAYGDECTDAFAEIAARSDVVPDKIVAVFDLAYGAALERRNASGHVAGCLCGNFVLELAASEPDVQRAADAIHKRWIDALTRIFLVDSGAPSPSKRASARSEAALLLACLHGVVVVAKASNDPEAIRNLGARYAARPR